MLLKTVSEYELGRKVIVDSGCDFDIRNNVITLIYALSKSGSVFTNHSQEHSLSLSPTFANWNETRILIG